MAKKGSRLREFEMNHRVLDISTSQEARRRKKENRKQKMTEADETASEVKSAAASGERTAWKRGSWMKLIGIAIILVFIMIAAMSVKNIYDLKAEEASLMQRNEELLRLKEELLMELDNVNSREYIEEQARKELKLVKGNELIFYFPEDWDETIREKNSSDETGSAADADVNGETEKNE